MISYKIFYEQLQEIINDSAINAMLLDFLDHRRTSGIKAIEYFCIDNRLDKNELGPFKSVFYSYNYTIIKLLNEQKYTFDQLMHIVSKFTNTKISNIINVKITDNKEFVIDIRTVDNRCKLIYDVHKPEMIYYDSYIDVVGDTKISKLIDLKNLKIKN